ncbi:hypothetical protein HYX02_07280 [Candidatus Woesearchaeota archaeon]|nr:hypothetical protein [Candidatus Woesearchaeota archaeon]
MKFLKREKKESLDELDLPPAPPPLEGFEENLPELPELPELEREKISAPQEEMPRFEAEEEKFPDLEMPKFDFPELKMENGEFELPPLEPETEQISPELPARTAIPEPKFTIPEPATQTEAPKMEAEPSLPTARGLFREEKRPMGKTPKTIYVRVDRFKATLGNINIVRSDLRKSEEALAKLENLKVSKDKAFEKTKSSLEDLQRKLIFIDKTLFKGD